MPVGACGPDPRAAERLADRQRRWLPGLERRRTELAVLGALALIAFVLAVTGLPYGLPEIYHPDTPKQLARVPHFMAGELVPPDTYPTLHMYVVALLLKFPLALVREPSFAELPPTRTEAAVVARLLSAALSAAIVPLVYVAGRHVLQSVAGAWTAAALVAVSPVLVLHAHYEMGDVLQALLVTAAVVAAVGAARTGRPAGFLLAGAWTGLAASAKYYGLVAFAAVVVALGITPLSRRRRLGLGAAAAALALAAFVAATPKVLLTPLEFVAQMRHSPELFVVRPPSWWQRPLVGGTLVAGLALAWFGTLGSLLAVGGAAALLARGAAGWLTLAVPLATLAVYVAWRPNYLDDRNLVILVPFVALATAAGLVWLRQQGRWARPAAAALALLVLGSAALESWKIAWLFWRGDTIQAAARWHRRHVPASATVAARLYVDDLARYEAADADLLRIDSRAYARHLRWYEPRAYPHVGRSLDLLAEHGKLLKRFELLPRGFIAPTIAYYDLDSMRVPYALPPPEDVVRGLDRLVFVDRDGVPERLADVVAPARPADLTVVSRTPLPYLAVALSGTGRVTVRQGLQETRRWLQPGVLRLVRFEPQRWPPWLAHAYPLHLAARDGVVLARLLVTPCDAASVLAKYGRWSEALPEAEACRAGRRGEPARLLDLAALYARAGRAADARRAVEALRRAAPGLLEGLAALAAEEDEANWRERYRTLAGHPRWFWEAHTFPFQLVEPRAQEAVVVDARRQGVPTVLARAGSLPGGRLEATLPHDLARGPYLVRFRLRGQVERGGPVATLRVVQHSASAPAAVLADRAWAPGPGRGRRDILIPVETRLEPVRLEVQVLPRGRGVLEIDEVALLPDVRGQLSGTLEALRAVVSP
jgi:hypothetical protein